MEPVCRAARGAAITCQVMTVVVEFPISTTTIASMHPRNSPDSSRSMSYRCMDTELTFSFSL
jgi:hypothetical protein